MLSNPATENPLFLLVGSEELRGFGSYEQLEDRIAAFPHEDDALSSLFAQIIQRLYEEFDGEVVRSVLTLLACSRDGLAERELQEMIEGVGIETATGDTLPVLRQLRPYLQYRAELLNFFDRNLYRAVRDHYLATDESRAATHARLADFFMAQDYFTESLEQQRARARRLPPTPRPVNIRKVVELPYQHLQVARLQGKDAQGPSVGTRWPIC